MQPDEASRSFPARLSRLLAPLEREVDEAFGTMIERRWRRAAVTATGWPAVDLYETDDAYLLLADLPGVAPEDIELHVERGRITLAGSRWSTAFTRHRRGLVVERGCGRFHRAFPIHEDIATDRVEQGYENGIYWARLPKQPSKGTHR